MDGSVSNEERAKTRERVARWRAANPEKAKQQTQEAVSRHRASKVSNVPARKQEARAAKRRVEAQALLLEAKRMREIRLANPVVKDPNNPWLRLQ